MKPTPKEKPDQIDAILFIVLCLVVIVMLASVKWQLAVAYVFHVIAANDSNYYRNRYLIREIKKAASEDAACK